MTPRFEEAYRKHYEDADFRQIYLTGRERVYRAVVRILRRLGIRQAVDVGCSFGLLVEYLNEAGIDACGVDLPLPQLQEFHARLKHSAGRFLYGNAPQMQFALQPDASALVALDSLRCFDDPGTLGEQAVEYLLIKETGARSWMTRIRGPEEQVRFYSPRDLLECFPAYAPLEIHASRFLFRVPRPSKATLALFNYMPSYTAVLKRRG